jgi:putative tricarboxylic transport membrane protein
MNDAAKSEPTALQDLIGGLLSIALGVFALVTASSYPMGSLLRMGPGFFPGALAGLIILLGFALIGAALRSRSNQPNVDIRLRSVVTIGLGIVLFAELLERAGLIPATLALVLVSSLAEPRWRPRRAIALALAMTALVYVIFIVVLQIPVAAVVL